MARNEDPAVLCPFYKEENEVTLICEGPVPDATMRMRFHEKGKMKIYKLRYCDRDYRKCPLACGLFRMWENKEKEKANDREIS